MKYQKCPWCAEAGKIDPKCRACDGGGVMLVPVPPAPVLVHLPAILIPRPEPPPRPPNVYLRSLN